MLTSPFSIGPADNLTLNLKNKGGRMLFRNVVWKLIRTQGACKMNSMRTS